MVALSRSGPTRIDPVAADHEALDSLRAREELGGGELLLRTADGTEISLPSSLMRLLVSVADNLAAGRAVMAIPAAVMLTPTEAAELLGPGKMSPRYGRFVRPARVTASAQCVRVFARYTNIGGSDGWIRSR